MKINFKMITMKRLLILSMFCIALKQADSQQIFINQGKIEYEKKLNIYKEIEGDTFLENLKDKLPQFMTSYFNLYFKDGKTLYEKGKDDDKKVLFFGDDGSEDDIIYTDLSQQKFVKNNRYLNKRFY